MNIYSSIKRLNDDQSIPLDFLIFCRFFTFKSKILEIAPTKKSSDLISYKSLLEYYKLSGLDPNIQDFATFMTEMSQGQVKLKAESETMDSISKGIKMANGKLQFYFA